MTEMIPAGNAQSLNLPAVNETGTALIMRAVEQMHGASQLANALAATSFVPAHFRGKPDDVAAAIMYGAAVGLDPMSALRAIYVVNGTPGMYARQMVAIIQAAGHKVWTEDSTDDAVTVCGQRRGSDHVERVEWTIDRAKKAGYTSNKQYQTNPQGMLWARAASDVARRVAPDALAGLDTSVEELRIIDHVDAPTVTSTAPSRPSAASVLSAMAPTMTPAPVTNPVPDEQPSASQIPINAVIAINTALTERGITNPDRKFEAISSIVGRKVTAPQDLTPEEAALVIDTLSSPVDPEGDDE